MIQEIGASGRPEMRLARMDQQLRVGGGGGERNGVGTERREEEGRKRKRGGFVKGREGVTQYFDDDHMGREERGREGREENERQSY